METKSLSEWIKDPRVPLKKITLWRAIKSGELKAFRPANGRKWLISEADIMAFLGGVKNENSND